MEEPLFDILRVGGAMAALVFASWTDLRWRRAPNLLWILLGAWGIALALIEGGVQPHRWESNVPSLLVSVFFVALVWIFYALRLLPGGADVKALTSLALLFPFPLDLGPLRTPLPGSMAMFGNSLLLSLLVPPFLAILNALRGDVRFPHLFVGYVQRIEKVDLSREWPMEVPDGKGGVVSRFLPSRFPPPTSEDLEALRECGVSRVWVTPKIPYLALLFGGVVVGVVVGDVLGSLLRALL